jgi:hypothetical protein
MLDIEQELREEGETKPLYGNIAICQESLLKWDYFNR